MGNDKDIIFLLAEGLLDLARLYENVTDLSPCLFNTPTEGLCVSFGCSSCRARRLAQQIVVER